MPKQKRVFLAVFACAIGGSESLRKMSINFISNCKEMFGWNEKSVKQGFLRQDDGSVAVEFALLGLPFFLLIVGLIEISLFFASGVAVEGAANASARILRTGQAQLSGDPLAAFEDKLCAQVGILVDCANLQYEVIAVDDDSFTNLGENVPSFDEDGNLESQGFDPGGSEDVIIVRIAYRHQFLTPFLGNLAGDDTATKSALHMSTVVLRNEPYEFGG